MFVSAYGDDVDAVNISLKSPVVEADDFVNTLTQHKTVSCGEVGDSVDTLSFAAVFVKHEAMQ